MSILLSFPNWETRIMKRPCLLSLRWAYWRPESHLNLLPSAILDKLVHPVA